MKSNIMCIECPDKKRCWLKNKLGVCYESKFKKSTKDNK